MTWLALQMPPLRDMFQALRLDLVITLALSVLAGGAIGFERRRRRSVTAGVAGVLGRPCSNGALTKSSNAC